MPTGLINIAKEAVPVSAQPLLLAEITFRDKATNPTVLRLSTHGLNVLDGGSQWNGYDWQPRILEQDVTATQALSEQGIDLTPSVTLKIADPDASIWRNYEQGIGFKGATLKLIFVFWNVDNGTVSADFSSDYLTKFLGICGSPSTDGMTVTLTATSKLNMSATQLPPGRIQKTCIWNFPASLRDRQDAADNYDSPFYECGYSPDATGGNAVGNLQATTSLSAAIGAPDTTITVGSITGALPVAPFVANLPAEAVVVTAVAGSSWTVIRGQQGSTAAAASSGAVVNVCFTSCDYTRDGCMARLGNSANHVRPSGDIEHDKAARHTGRFGGIQWAPAQTSVSRGYISGKWEEIVSNTNEAKYGDLIPLVYGTAWVTPKVLWVTGDANYTWFEALLCFGKINYVWDVVVNGVRIPHTYDDAILTQVPSELGSSHNIGGGYWKTVNDGDRNGNFNRAINEDADPYGSLAVLHIQVPKALADASSAPNVQIRVDGPKIWTYTDVNTRVRQFSPNPAWVMLDILQWANWRIADIDIQSFINAAAACDAVIPFHDQFGNVGSTINGGQPYRRYSCSMSLAQRNSAAEIVRGLRNAMKALVVPNYSTGGALQVIMKSTLAAQQPSAVAGSNYNTAISSFLPNTTAANGYVAYAFDETNIVRKSGKTTLQVTRRQIEEQANSTSITFQNAENRWNADSTTISDTEDIARVGRQITGTLQTQGINTFDQARRVIATWMAEGFRGNSRLSTDGQIIGDTGGTDNYEFETTSKAVHLKLGDIILVTEQQRGIANQLARITSIQPASNFETVKIIAAFHNDIWYFDYFGQVAAPKFRSAFRNVNGRPPYAWSPQAQQPPVGDSLFDHTDWNFQASQTYEQAADGTSIAKLNVEGKLPINLFAKGLNPPFVDFQGTTAATGGTIHGGLTYFVAICAKDTAGSVYKLSAPSQLATVFVPAGTNTNTITVSVPAWDSPSAGYVVFAGTDAAKLTYQGDADTTPASIQLTAFNASSWGLPDINFNYLRIYAKRIIHAGVWGTQVVAVTSGTIQVSDLAGDGFTVNQFAGYDVSLAGICDASDINSASASPVPIFDARVASNTADTLTLATGSPDPTASGIKLGDVLIMRILPVFGSDATGNYFEDANFINALNPLLEPYTITALAWNGSAVAATLAAPTPWATGDTIYFQGTGTNTDGIHAVTVIDSTHVTLNGLSSLTGTWTGAGVAQAQYRGLIPGAEVGHIIRFIAGTGRGQVAKVKSNTATRLYIEGDWPTAPDSTSRIIIEEPIWQIAQDMEAVNNDSPNTLVPMLVDVNNYKAQMLIVQAVSVDGGDQEALSYNSPIREIYLFGGASAAGFSGAVYLTVDGTLGIGSNQAPIAATNKDTRMAAMRAVVKQAPSGAALVVRVNVGGSPVVTLSIASGQIETEATAGEISAAPTLAATSPITLDVISTGTTFPGSDLSVAIYF